MRLLKATAVCYTCIWAVYALADPITAVLYAVGDVLEKRGIV